MATSRTTGPGTWPGNNDACTSPATSTAPYPGPRNVTPAEPHPIGFVGSLLEPGLRKRPLRRFRRRVDSQLEGQNTVAQRPALDQRRGFRQVFPWNQGTQVEVDDVGVGADRALSHQHRNQPDRRTAPAHDEWCR